MFFVLFCVSMIIWSSLVLSLELLLVRGCWLFLVISLSMDYKYQTTLGFVLAGAFIVSFFASPVVFIISFLGFPKIYSLVAGSISPL